MILKYAYVLAFSSLTRKSEAHIREWSDHPGICR